MAYDWMGSFIVPLVQVTLLLGIIIFITWVFGRIIMKYTKKLLLPFLRYKVMKNDYAPDKVQWCVEAVDKGLSEDKVTQKLLVKGFSKDEVYDMLYIFKKVRFEMKGGIDNGRQSKRRDSEDKATTGKRGLPEF